MRTKPTDGRSMPGPARPRARAAATRAASRRPPLRGIARRRYHTRAAVETPTQRAGDVSPPSGERDTLASTRGTDVPRSLCWYFAGPYTPAALRRASALSVFSQVNVRQLAAEVAVAGRLAVDRPAQVQRLDDALRRQLEVLADQLDELVVGHARWRRAVRVDPDVERVGVADGVARAAPRTAWPGRPRRCSWRCSGPCTRPSDRPWSGPCR